MSVGLASRFNILQQSPHDLSMKEEADPNAQLESATWIPSRYNIRAFTDDGRLILWNSFRGSMSVFKPHQSEKIISLLTRKGVKGKREGIIAYLSDRGFLIEDGANEYRQVQVAINQQQFRTDRLELILLASEDCNFRCTYCYEQFARGTMLPEVRTGIKNLVQKRLKRLSSLQVSWFGGEPLYGLAAIEDLAPFFREIADLNDIAYSSSMTTNGYLLTPEVADRLFAWRITHFQITLDGAQEDHDRSRPARDGSPTFSRILDNLIALSKRPDEFGATIRVNFDQQNHTHLSEFLHELECHFSGDHRFVLNFFPVGRWGGPNDRELQVCGTDEAHRLEKDFKKEARRRGLRVGDLKGINRLGGAVCYAARPYNLIIGATGKVMKCTILLDTQASNIVGTLNEAGELEVNGDRMALWTEPAFENDKQCQKCVVLPVCQGTHCPLVRIEQNKSPCCSVRSNPKAQLLEALEHHGCDARRSVVEAIIEQGP